MPNPTRGPSPTDATLAYRQATGRSPVKATPADAFRAARARIRSGEKLDMVTLANDLGVARTTLYRWSGDRDRLLADVIVAELQDLITAAFARTTARGAERIDAAVGWFLETIAVLPPLRAFLVNEGRSGLHMLISPHGPVRPRLAATVVEAIEREVTDGYYRPPAQPALLADGIIALAERYLHNAGDQNMQPDPIAARTIAALLIREPCI